jgi:nicotinate-nucleotide pyrophosphorylase (carboxylating)
MVMLKDNHIDFAGGVEQAITNTKNFLAANNLDLKIEIEVRDFDELAEAMRVGGIDRIMLDNFTPENLEKALQIIDDKYETEASGGITLETLRSYAETGVDFISVGALTHSYKSLDMSLKSEFGINR